MPNIAYPFVSLYIKCGKVVVVVVVVVAEMN